MEKTKSVLKRFVKGAIGGAVSAMVAVSYTTPSAWTDFAMVANTLGIAAVAGAIGGALLAAQKWASWTE